MKRYFLILSLVIIPLTAFFTMGLTDFPSWAGQKSFVVFSSLEDSEPINISSIFSLLLGKKNSNPLTADAGATPSTGDAPLTVHFTTNSTGPVQTWRWDFNGDSSWDWEGQTEEDRFYTFNSVGAYTATLQVEDSRGNTAEDLVLVSVTSSAPPVITFRTDAEQLFTGQSATLIWSIIGGFQDSVVIDQEIGAVDPAGSRAVSPALTTKYTLTADGPGGTSTAEVEIRVLTPKSSELAFYINDPADGDVVPTDTVTVNGIVNQPTAQVWVNGVLATVAGQIFAADVSLEPGLNELKATATYTTLTANDSAWVIREYTYTPQPKGSFGENYEDLVPKNAAIEAYDKERFAVITGLIEDEQSQPVADVSITIKDHPEYGTAYTDTEGRFSLPVEGAASYIVVYQHESYLTAHRTIEVQSKDIAVMDLVRLVVQDTKASIVIFDGNPDTVVTHEGSPVPDDSGSHSMTMVFQGDNQAWEVDRYGQRIRKLTTIGTRATEFTTPESMPSVLPPNSAFTYCAELSVDGAARIEFEKPVISWVDNFLGFEVGEIVPVGYYNRDTGAWVPSDNGVVVKLLDYYAPFDGVVDSLDATGDGNPDDLNESSVFADEVVGLSDSSRYAPGDTFWRVEVKHFSPWDHNWPRWVPEDAVGPEDDNTPDTDQQEDDFRKNNHEDNFACSIEPQSRILHEDISIPGTGYSMHYTSNRVHGYQAEINIPVSGTTIPNSLLRFEVKLVIAGKTMTQTLGRGTDKQAIFRWDGLDYQGNLVTQPKTALVSVGFVYKVNYAHPSAGVQRSFAQSGLSATSVEAREEIIIWRDRQLRINNFSVEGYTHFGAGWSLSSQHFVLPGDGLTLYKGDGSTIRDNSANIINTYAGGGLFSESSFPPGTLATEINFENIVQDIVRDSKGNTFLSVPASCAVYKVSPDGIITRFAGTAHACSSGSVVEDGGPADQVYLSTPTALAVDNEDNVYIADPGHYRIRRVDANGIISTVMGNGGPLCRSNCTKDDNTLGTKDVSGLDIDKDGNLYLVNLTTSTIGKLDLNGIYTTIGGGCDGDGCPSGEYTDGQLAVDVTIIPRGGIVHAPDGSIYFTSIFNVVRRIDSSGILSTVGGTWDLGPQFAESLDGDVLFAASGTPATDEILNNPTGLALDSEGNIYITESFTIRKIDTGGTISTIAGSYPPGFSGDGGLASYAKINPVQSYSSKRSSLIIIDDTLYFSDNYLNKERFRMISLEPPMFVHGPEEGGFSFAEDNGLGHILSSTGQHEKTIDLRTGVILKEFFYDIDDRLVAVTDQLGNSTTIQYNISKVPVTITSPDGLITGLGIDANNHLTRVTYPDNGHYDFTYGQSGLLETKREPTGNLYSHTFDAFGKLTEVSDQEGGQWGYTRTSAANGIVTNEVVTVEGNTTVYTEQTSSSGESESTVTTPSGSTTTTTWTDDGLIKHTERSSGMIHTVYYNLDPEYQTQYAEEIESITPADLTMRGSTSTAYEDTDSDGHPDLITKTITVNGKTSSVVQNILSSQKQTSSPEGRTTTLTYDPATLQPSRFQVPDMDDMLFAYNSRGQITTQTQGTRSIIRDYTTSGFLHSLRTPKGETTTYSHDASGRTTEILHADGNQTSMIYDATGSITQITTPAGISHQFSFNTTSKLSAYTLPNSGGSYSYSYNRDRQLTQVTFPSGGKLNNTYTDALLTRNQLGTGSDVINISYLAGDRVEKVSRGSETIDYTYDGQLLLNSITTGTLAQTVSRSYNNDFLTTNIHYAGGDLSFGYDDDNLLISTGGITITRNNSNGLPEQLSDGTLIQTRTFNAYAELDSVSNTVNSDSVFSWTATRDLNGRITQKVETKGVSSRTFAYVYDDLGRLLTVSLDGTEIESYQYDANGNRSSDLNNPAYVYDTQDRLTSIGTTAYTHNPDGFLTSIKHDTDPATIYNYSIRGELLGVTLPDSTSITYIYDPQGRRIAKSVGGTITEKYLWGDQTTLLAVYDGSDTLLMRFEYGDRSTPALMNKGGVDYYLIYDQVGSLRMVTDSDGVVTKQVDYSAFGKVTSDSNPTFRVPFGFAGGLVDADTGMIHFAFRDYNPEAGRWNAKDPLFFAAGDTNFYAYVSNDPVNLIDPLGLSESETNVNTDKTKPYKTYLPDTKLKSDVSFLDSPIAFVTKMLDVGSHYFHEITKVVTSINYLGDEEGRDEAFRELEDKRDTAKLIGDSYVGGLTLLNQAGSDAPAVAGEGLQAIPSLYENIKSAIFD